MGHGIAQSAAQSGFNVIAYEEEDRFLESGRSRIEGSLGKMLKREKITKDKYDEIRTGVRRAAVSTVLLQSVTYRS